MRQDLSLRLEQFKRQYVEDEAVRSRIAEPPVKFIGDEIMEIAAAALLQGENVLLSGGKATGKNILADNLAWLFARPVYTVSFHVNTDSSTLIGTDTFTGGEVRLRRKGACSLRTLLRLRCSGRDQHGEKRRCGRAALRARLSPPHRRAGL